VTAPLVEVQGLGKRYPVLGHRGDRLRALRDMLLGRPPQRNVGVLEDVSFSVMPGQSLAIIGENGAGKSTLLKLVTGVLTPSAGTVRTRGSIGALIELGAGFHPEFSGRDNVRMAAALHGLDAPALAAKMPEIEAFADIGDYLDEPVKHYSTGMVVRLGFAVIAAVRPALLVTDEVLAVGDESFQKKCIRWLDDYLAGGGTLLLVSHSMYHVQKLCRRAIWLHHGRIEASGDVFEVSQRYLAWHEARQAVEAAPPAAMVAEVSVQSATSNGHDGPGPLLLAVGDTLEHVAVLATRDGRAPVCLVGLARADGTPVYGVSSEMDGIAAEALGDGRFRFVLRFDRLPLLPGEYRLRTHALDGEGLRLFDTVERPLLVGGEAREFGLVRLPHRWGDA
jgi:lipopolysaccharide transport system ATP-binding protein